MDNILKKRICSTVKSLMEVDISNMDLKTPFNTISNWDSFNNLMLISKFQNDLKVEFTAIEIENARNIGDLFNLIEKKLTQKK